jgi:hypothetical protein
MRKSLRNVAEHVRANGEVVMTSAFLGRVETSAQVDALLKQL